MNIAVLMSRSFRRTRGLLLSLTTVLVVFQILVVLAATYIRGTEGFTQLVSLLPAVVQQLAGALFGGFGSMVAFGYFHPVVIIVFVGTAIVVASEPAADVESGIVDLVLARPVARWQLIARSLLMTAVTTTTVAGLMLAASRLGTAFLAPPDASVSTRVLAKLAANLVAVAWIMGALSLALAAMVRRRAAAAGAAGVTALALYLLNFLAEIWPRLTPYGRFSPFHYYQPMAIVAGAGERWAIDVATLVTGATTLSVIAFVAFSRRDV